MEPNIYQYRQCSAELGVAEEEREKRQFNFEIRLSLHFNKKKHLWDKMWVFWLVLKGVKCSEKVQESSSDQTVNFGNSCRFSFIRGTHHDTIRECLR